MTDLKTHYLGLELKNPLVAAASGLSKKVSTVKKMEDAGISAVVLYSLFEEQITHDSLAFNYFMEHGTERFAESLSYFPNLDRYNVSPDEYLEKIRQNKEAVDIPIIASLNGVSNSGWVEYAQKMVQAGADALELNTYYLPTNSDMKSVELEDNLIELVKAVCTHVQIPVSVKLSPYYTALPNLACRLADAGAQGLVLFNRFIQPDIDIEEMEVDPTLNLSTSAELLLPLRWTAILFGQVKADLALTSGVHTGVDLIKAVMAGANVAMVASEFVANGVGRATEMLAEMSTWMSAYDHPSVERMRGSMSQKHVKNPAVFERANYMKALQSFDNKMP
ncbi:MAG TPA: dihydroorotate dehydrogenase-like protein [Brevefilum fermentans]|jgi:dihydroorotate dehydrogenase (fumarate)|uniref:Dihydroorotate dehydrogenase family protein n=1 Tax=Candidatus Brevifilum fermentans TaxID=1986204 RepID=A0A1Y6K181_9CHLR|nr:dihydroorotate dehydrogenase-like protein [Brevefilum fermentans]MDI9566213.1 dihydroorotate dehydrogenase-like protein [Chloroflexota bacterium]OQB87953.1 MAG: Dihydroorotate dehydrogenase B (NAD(+)), catalytic subunit [Chloroflexi bacterium ADurb.Bin120]SMX53391.1 Dihydroorotate dehydrogenase family protein [Brevefilum fermentans]HOM67171.1 dihydroorotate dehydrogenase-like protein [Brevefilum fermentans]HPX95538.1 dihydroorotate dehydrogenase-like protein [Brevefilum fermentans]